ncbi:MAG: FKBP-type peptidyl-prolyl cis-trans isomerase [Caldilineaceae bacterium]
MLKRVSWSLVGVLIAITLLFAACGGEQPTPTPEPPAVEATATPGAAEPTATTPAEPAAITAAEPVTDELPSTLPTVEGTSTKTASGLEIIEIVAGTGESPKPGEVVSVHYTGTLTNGAVFDSSYLRGEPISFPIGQGAVIPGWDEGISKLKVGGKARLIIPPELGYGANGAGGVIPPNATLVFDVELVKISAGAPAAPTDVNPSDYISTTTGLKYYDFVVGDGASPQAGQTVTVQYTGWLEDGTKFDSSFDHGQPIQFIIGQGQVIKGWDEGVLSMKVGGKRQLVIPAELGYGANGAGGVIPPNATLIFEVELLGVQ